MNTNDQKPNVSVEEAHERAQDDVRMGKQADVEGAGAAQQEAERKYSSHHQAQAREAADAKANAEEHAEPKERANEDKARQPGWQAQAADPTEHEQHRQSHERLQHQEKRGHAADEAESRSREQARGDGYEYPVTEHRMDAMASAATTDSPEARENEAGPTDNISEHGAYSDNPDEVDQISGPPMESISKDQVDKK